MSWNLGYVSEIDYTHGYYREMSPLMLELSLLSKRQAHRLGRPLRYLELGFGQGLSLNMHAASMDGEFWGTDFNPSQAANARDLAVASGANLRILDESFADLAKRDDLPEFDVIALHGIWSWISAENRQRIVDLAKHKLVVGGVLYVSYNATPGWSAAMPLRHLMTLHSELASGEAQGIVGRIDSAIAFAQQVVDSNALYFRANPAVAERLKRIRDQNRNYLAHEFFNADWDPMPFSEVAAMLAEGKLSFGASANLFDHIDHINFRPETMKLLDNITHPVLRESVRDYCVNQQFRRDVFVKGPRVLSELRQRELLRAMRFVLLTNREAIPMKIVCALGDANLQPEVYQPLIEALAQGGYSPKSVADLANMETLRNLPFPGLVEALLLLTAAGHASPAQDETVVESTVAKTQALNAYLMDRATYSGDIGYLTSPVIAGGVAVPGVHQIFLHALQRGAENPKDLATKAWARLSAQGRRMLKDGKTIESAEDNLAALLRQAEEFVMNRMPLLRALRVA